METTKTLWNKISQISSYPRASDGLKTYRITFDTVEIRDAIEPLIHEIDKLPDGYFFELTEGLEEFVAKVRKMEATKKTAVDKFNDKYLRNGIFFIEETHSQKWISSDELHRFSGESTTNNPIKAKKFNCVFDAMNYIKDNGLSFKEWIVTEHEFISEEATKTVETKTLQEFTSKEVFEWFNKQRFQREQGEQEYTMIYEIDLPKIINAFIKNKLAEQLAAKDKTIEEQAKRIEDLEQRLSESQRESSNRSIALAWADEELSKLKTGKESQLVERIEELEKALTDVRGLIYVKDEENGGWACHPMHVDFGTILNTIDKALNPIN